MAVLHAERGARQKALHFYGDLRLLCCSLFVSAKSFHPVLGVVFMVVSFFRQITSFTSPARRTPTPWRGPGACGIPIQLPASCESGTGVELASYLWTPRGLKSTKRVRASNWRATRGPGSNLNACWGMA